MDDHRRLRRLPDGFLEREHPPAWLPGMPGMAYGLLAFTGTVINRFGADTLAAG